MCPLGQVLFQSQGLCGRSMQWNDAWELSDFFFVQVPSMFIQGWAVKRPKSTQLTFQRPRRESLQHSLGNF